MKPLRIIERIAYGDGTPDELADEVPTWEESQLHYLNVRSEFEARCWVADRLGVEWGAGS